MAKRSPSGVPGTSEPGFVAQAIYHDRDSTIQMREMFTRQHGFQSTCDVWRMGEVSIIVALEPAAANGEKLWHLSISRTDRHPSWDEIKQARYKLLPVDKCFGMLLPPPQFYVNVPSQDHVFHLWEITDPREPWTTL